MRERKPTDLFYYKNLLLIAGIIALFGAAIIYGLLVPAAPTSPDAERQFFSDLSAFTKAQSDGSNHLHDSSPMPPQAQINSGKPWVFRIDDISEEGVGSSDTNARYFTVRLSTGAGTVLGTDGQLIVSNRNLQWEKGKLSVVPVPEYPERKNLFKNCKVGDYIWFSGTIRGEKDGHFDLVGLSQMGDSTDYVVRKNAN